MFVHFRYSFCSWCFTLTSAAGKSQSAWIVSVMDFGKRWGGESLAQAIFCTVSFCTSQHPHAIISHVQQIPEIQHTVKNSHSWFKAEIIKKMRINQKPIHFKCIQPHTVYSWRQNNPGLISSNHSLKDFTSAYPRTIHLGYYLCPSDFSQPILREKEAFSLWFLPRNAAMFMTWLNTQLAGGVSPAILWEHKARCCNSGVAEMHK